MLGTFRPLELNSRGYGISLALPRTWLSLLEAHMKRKMSSVIIYLPAVFHGQKE
jgi:hypothetical protein